MGIYRCNKCGHLAEHAWQPNMAEVGCPKCHAPNKVYDTLFFVQKLLERYFAVNRELQALKIQEQESTEEHNQQQAQQAEHEQSNLLIGVNLAATDVLATAEQHEPLKQWFFKQNIVPAFDYSAVDMSGYFDEAAAEIGDKYHITKDILGRIGWAYRNSHTGINIDVGKMAQKDAQLINNLCRQFYSHTLFAKYFYQKQEKVIRLNLQKAAAIKHFFSGGWLEWYVLGKMLTEAKQRGKTYTFSCARNVKIKFGNEDIYELDVVLMPLGQPPLIIECKSGEFRKDIEKYVRLKKRLNLPAERFIVLATDLEATQAAALSSMYELTFATPKTLMKHIRETM
ncbi:zinc ribbon domain-containing protein [Neisseria sp. 83E34]|uniref:FmdB family zinc ribbon protein n=1 Tax=Neisseria sp. 83E34 TaxID=1692264 RepID=UPI0006CE855A|nr:zinc ribbon domain-containing protein [Neisseria sp. 83E34]KPN72084.1 hypothetical protein AKG09_02630 [Neisseria sp. 83E34]